MGSKYFKKLDLLRVAACISVFLYHLGLLKGGYLAVCTFFVLSGYLSCVSAFKKDRFLILNYYKKRFFSLWLPLLGVVFITIGVISLFPSINWFNLKPETTSVLFGYNNFWQLGANLDYFSRHIDSPFVHLWYISILFQFDLVFPFIFVGLNKLKEKTNRLLPCLLITVLSIIGMILFSKYSTKDNIMLVYYNTLFRVFSLLFGVSAGFIYHYYGRLTLKILDKRKIFYYLYFIALIYLYIFIDAKSDSFTLGMILSTLFTYRIIAYSTSYGIPTTNFDFIVKSISSVSYEIYLIQYPVIFLFQYVSLPSFIKVPFIIILTLFLSGLMKCALNCMKKKDERVKRLLIALFIIIFSIYGAYKYIVSVNHTEELKNLKAELKTNEELLKKKQQEFKSKSKEEEDTWQSALADLENGAEKVKDAVKDLRIVGIGDSVMLGAVDNLYSQFPNGYFDADISRTAWIANGLCKSLASNGLLGDPVVFNLGTNGDCSESCKDEIMGTLGDRKVFWINVVNDSDVHVNANLQEFADKYNNAYVIDWYSASLDQSDYFYADGIHLTEIGKVAYTQTIYNTVYKVYLDEYNAHKEKIIKEHEEAKKNAVTFYGNDLLLNSMKYFGEDISNYETVVEYDFDSLYEDIKNRINDNTITNRVALIFDDDIKLTVSEYKKIAKLLKNKKVYIVTYNSKINITNSNVTVLDFYSELKKHKEYLMVDKKHLSEEGNKALSDMLSNTFGKKE